MKPLLILMRIIFVGIFWSIFFLEGIRSIMLINWRFDIIRTSHWQHAWNLWLSGWVIDDPKEWAFVLIILTFIPVWLTGWAALSMVRWGKIFKSIAFIPLKIFNKLFEKPVQIITKTASVKVVKKKKSYKEIRPRSIRAPLEETSYALPSGSAKNPAPVAGLSPQGSLQKPVISPAPAASETPSVFEHSLFSFDDEPSDFDFDLFDEKPKTETPAPVADPAPTPDAPRNNKNNRDNNRDRNRDKNNRDQNNRGNNNRDNNRNSPARNEVPVAPARNNSNSTLDVLTSKGYEVITGATIKNTLIDFIGVADNQICICLNDKEPGDWLADEERFNDEEPLWFSESSHRISPVRKADIARLILKEKLNEADLSFTIDAYVIEQIGNIINAEDMFEIWNDMKINVTRIDRGTPKELRLFAKTLEDASAKVSREKFEKVKKLIRSIA